MNNFPGLSFVNIELTSRCNKNCWMCGRRKMDREYPELVKNYGDMDFKLLKYISQILPDGIVIQFHNNGEPLLYPRLGEALSLFKNQIRCLDTNGKLLVKKQGEIVNQLDTITVSVIQDDPEQDDQYDIVKQFLEFKGERKPRVILRLLGEVEEGRWKNLNQMIVRRVLHDSAGSFNYKKEVVKPEIGICLEILSRMVISKDGIVSPCVRFDPDGLNVIGSIKYSPLPNIWDGERRHQLLEKHINGDRNQIPFCSKCDYWGIPRG